MNQCINEMGKLFSRFNRGSSSYKRKTSKTKESQRNSNTENVSDIAPPLHSDAVTCVVPISNEICLSASKDKSIAIFNFKSNKVQQKWYGHENEVTKVVYGNVIDTIISASRDTTIKLWKLGEDECLKTFTGHDLVVTGLSLNTDNRLLCSGSRDNSVRLWNIETGQCISQKSISRNLVTHLRWGRDSHIMAQTSEDKEVRIWDTRKLQVSMSFPRKQYIQMCCDLTSDNTYCLTSSNGFGGNGCEATLWDLRTIKPVCEYVGHLESTGACTFLPNIEGFELLATSSNDSTLCIWNQITQECVCSLSLSGSGPLVSIAFFSDFTLALASFNLGVQIVNLTENGGTFNLAWRGNY